MRRMFTSMSAGLWVEPNRMLSVPTMDTSHLRAPPVPTRQILMTAPVVAAQ